MSPQEYRDKLQETISARQAQRRKDAHESGIIGNRSSSGYLDALGGGGGRTDPMMSRRNGGGDGDESDVKTNARPPRWSPK